MTKLIHHLSPDPWLLKSLFFLLALFVWLNRAHFDARAFFGPCFCGPFLALGDMMENVSFTETSMMNDKTNSPSIA